MPIQPLPLFTISHLYAPMPARRERPVAGSLARRRLRRLLAIACANDLPDAAGSALVLELHSQLLPAVRAD